MRTGIATIFVVLTAISAGITLSPIDTVAENLVTADKLFGERSNKSGGFFERGAASSVFAEKVSYQDKAELKYFPDPSPTFNLAPEPILEAPKTKEQEEADKAKLIEKLPPAERIVMQYGSPLEDLPVKAVKDAPKPVQAIYECLQNHEDELAFQYAKQYARYLSDIQESSTRVTSIMGEAFKREDVVQDASWKNAPRLIEDQLLSELDKNRTKGEAEAQIQDIDKRAQELLKKLKDENSADYESGEVIR